MFLRKNWRPVSFFIVAIAVLGVYLLQTDTRKSPIKTYKSVEAAPKPPPPGETAENGHWHGDAWHAKPHDTALEVVAAPVEDDRDVELEAYEASLSHFTAEERATYDRALNGEIVRHREKYPDCQDHEAVFKDADRFSRWYLADKAHRKIVDAARAEWEALLQERPFTLDSNELVKMRNTWTDAEKAAWTAKGDDWIKRRGAAFQRYNEIKAQPPVSPQPRHTH